MLRNGFPSKEKLAMLRERYPKGTRIMLECMDDPYTKLVCGDVGTVDFVDDAGTISMIWDRGSSLGLIPGVDSFHIVKEG